MERVHPELCQASFPDFAPLVDPVVETLTLHADLNDNFAVFFWLQRSFRSGGEHLTKYCPDHIAYDHLFLALYRHEIAEEFASIEYNRVWQQEYLPRAEMVAAYVRNSFCRIGNGPASSGDFGMTSFLLNYGIKNCTLDKTCEAREISAFADPIEQSTRLSGAERGGSASGYLPGPPPGFLIRRS